MGHGVTRAIALGGLAPPEPHRLLFGELLHMLTREEIDAAILMRLAQIPKCVGQLYPAIMLREVEELEARRGELA